jgi:hypothetical protein
MALSTSRLSLRMFPNDDESFTGAVESLADANGGGPDQLQHRLRMLYPHAVVRRRDPIAADGPGEIWYVYRDGSLVHGHDPRAEAGRDSGVETSSARPS